MTGIDLALEGVVFEQDGQIVATQTAAEVLGNPLVSLAWAANALGKMGRGLHAGDVVLTGSISKVLRPTGGAVGAGLVHAVGVGLLSFRVSRIATGSFPSNAGAQKWPPHSPSGGHSVSCRSRRPVSCRPAHS